MDRKLFDLTGRIALVTGSGRGIGFTLAQGLARSGCSVILNDIVENRLKGAVDSLKEMNF